MIGRSITNHRGRTAWNSSLIIGEAVLHRCRWPIGFQWPARAARCERRRRRPQATVSMRKTNLARLLAPHQRHLSERLRAGRIGPDLFRQCLPDGAGGRSQAPRAPTVAADQTAGSGQERQHTGVCSSPPITLIILPVRGEACARRPMAYRIHEDAVRQWSRLELALVSYWEWFKLIVTAVLISCAMTAVAVALGGSPPGRPYAKSTFEPCIPTAEPRSPTGRSGSDQARRIRPSFSRRQTRRQAGREDQCPVK
jgi:hypothetical protein